jgi:thymidylate kinase
MRPTGLFVVFMGPDGAGKSTVIGEVVNHLEPVFWTTSILHLRPSLGQRTDGPPTPVTDPHGQVPRGQLASMLKMLYYLIDYLAGHWVRVLPKRAQASMVIFDRYYHDILVDPRRYRYGGPEWFVRLLSHWIPQPDLFVFLDVAPEIAQARKQEVSLKETRRQCEAYRALAVGQPWHYLVDAGRSVRDVTGAVEKIIIEHMTRRMQCRLKEWGAMV